LGRGNCLGWPQDEEENVETGECQPCATALHGQLHDRTEEPGKRKGESVLQRALGSGDQIESRRRRKKKTTAKSVDKWVAKKPMPSLPNEMWDKILSHCDPSSLAAVCGVCKSMRRTALPHRTAFRIDAAKLDQGT
jgi:hypothetical protein